MPAAGSRAREQGLKKYQALTNLSIPMPDDKDKRTVLVSPGDTIELTEEQARNLTSGHRVPVIRPAAEGSEPLPRIRGMDLSGRLRVPTIPAADPNYDGPRPDPEGSSHLQFLEGVDPSLTAEAREPQPGSQNAIDLPPGTRVADGIAAI